MSQTSIIMGTLILGFVIYIALKGQLPGYLWVFGLGGTRPTGC